MFIQLKKSIIDRMHVELEAVRRKRRSAEYIALTPEEFDCFLHETGGYCALDYFRLPGKADIGATFTVYTFRRKVPDHGCPHHYLRVSDRGYRFEDVPVLRVPEGYEAA